VHADNVGSRQFMDIRTVRAAALLNPPPTAKTVPTLFSRVFGSRAPSRPLRGRARADLRVSIPLHHPRPSAPSPRS
jgi:hypothetical protein